MRMSSRTAGVQMPPIATEITDPEGLPLIQEWITDYLQ
jgi:hypothetical protein